MELISQPLSEVIAKNPKWGFMLHQFGIEFYRYTTETLQEICAARGLNLPQLVRGLESIAQQEQIQEHLLVRYPIDFVVRYLQHAHYVFLNHKLPYMASLVENLTIETIGNAAIIRDLQTFFPLFIDEFIEHIHEEEDTFFKYILLLHQASHGKFKQGELYQAMEKNPVHFFALEHHIHDDEMRGIREITNDYTLDAKATLHLVVLYEEFKSFERDLKLHARIEDCVLLPKAIRLEKLVKAMLHPKVKLN